METINLLDIGFKTKKKEDKGVLLLEDEAKRKRIHFKYVLFLERWHNVGEIDAQLYYDKSDDYMEIETVAIDLDRP